MKIKMTEESKWILSSITNNDTPYRGKMMCEFRKDPNVIMKPNERNIVGTVSKINTEDMSINISPNRKFGIIFGNKQVKAIPVTIKTWSGLKLEKFDVIEEV